MLRVKPRCNRRITVQGHRKTVTRAKAQRAPRKNTLSFRPKGEIFLSDPSHSLGMTGLARHFACLASWRDKLSNIRDLPLTCESGSYENAIHFVLEGKVMERTVAWLGVALPEQVLFLLKSGIFLCASGVILYVALASSYPAVHDTLHNFRHALAVVPCH
jgi:Probable cobalt transporter subunit (CbtB)